jgi:hypothetical protein
MMSMLFSGRGGLRRLAVAGAAMLVLGACRHPGDLMGERPAPRNAIELRATAAVDDTMQLVLTLGEGPVASLGSLTARVTNAPGWKFVGCRAAQGAPLFACEEQADHVGVASAWVAGTSRGSLLSLVFARQQANAAGTWQLSVQQVSNLAGVSLADSLEVHEAVVRPDAR